MRDGDACSWRVMSSVASQRLLQIGIVPYLNVQPLIWSLTRPGSGEGDPSPLPARIIPQPPRRLAENLRAGHFDAAIVPVFEYLLNPVYSIVPGVSIACRGPVHSVALFSETPLEKVRTVRLDPASLTSVHLIQVLLAERGIRVRFEPAPPVGGSDSDGPGRGGPPAPLPLEPGTAQVVIGDPAMARRGMHSHEYDLGALWLEQTGLPFVFAAWLVPPGSRHLPVAATLQKSARTGRGSLEQVAADTAELFGFTVDEALRYYRENMVYDLGEEELAGWRHYATLCVRHGLIDRVPDFRFQER